MRRDVRHPCRRDGRSAPAALALALLAGCGPPPGTPEPARPAPPSDWTEVRQAVDSAVAAGAAPGAVVAVSFNGQRWTHAAGRIGNEQPSPPNGQTVYDLASLTKVVALTTLLMMAVDDGRLTLDEPATRYLPEFAGRDVTIRHLLTHSSGLPAHRPLWRETGTRAEAIALVLSTPLDTVPGTKTVYSDLGAMTLGVLVERAFGRSIDALATTRIFEPLGMQSTRYRPPADWAARIAPTELDPWRDRMIHGEVHDENAAHLGGVSGHAGLFGPADDLLRFGEWLLRRHHDLSPARGEPALTASVVREFTRRQDVVPGSTRALGWDTPSPGGSAGSRLGPSAFGHTGFTGTSLWIDPARDLVIVLLSNRVHPTRDNPRLAPLRALVADRVVEALERTIR